MSHLPRISHVAAVAASALAIALGAAATASADLRIPTLGEATKLTTTPESTSYGAAVSSDGNATFVAYSETRGGIMFRRIGSAGTDIGEEFQLQSPGTGSIGAPQVVSTGDHVYVAWVGYSSFGEDYVAVAASDNGGRTFKPAVRASKPTGHGVWDAALAADGDNVFVAWSDDRNRLWTAGSRDGGATFVCQATINRPGEYLWGGTFDLAVDGPRVHWAWLTEDFDVYTRRSTDAGRTLEQPHEVRDGTAADPPGSPNIDAYGGVVAITTSQMYRMPRADHTGTDFGDQPVLTTSQDGGRTWAEQNIGRPSDRCVGDYCSAPYSLDISGADVYVGWRAQGQMWLAHSADGGVLFQNARPVGPYSYTWHTQQMPSVSARGDSVVVSWHTAPDPSKFDLDPVAAFSSDRGETFTLRTVDDRPGQDLSPAGVAWGPDPLGAGFTWMSLEKTLLSGDRNVVFKPLSASEPDVAVLEVTPVQAAQDAARLAAGRDTTIRVKFRSAAPQRARVPVDIDLAYDEDGERVERQIHKDVVLKPGVNTVQLLADDPVVVGAGRVTAKVKVSPDLYDADHSNDEGEGSRAVVEPRPFTVLFVPVAATDEGAPACADVTDVAQGFEEHMLATWPVNPRYSTVITDCSSAIRHAPGLTDAGLMSPNGLLARVDRQKWDGISIDKVVGVTPRGWFSRQAMPGLANAVGAAPLGGTLDAALVERQNTGGWVVAHELAHQFGWTEEAGQHGHHLDEVAAPGYWAAERRDIPATTLDFMHFSTAGGSVTDTTGRWISKQTWDFLTGKLASSVLGARALADAQTRTLSMTGTVKADGSVTAGATAVVDGEPDAGEGEGPLTFEQLDGAGTVIQTRHFGASNELGPIGGDAATGEEHAVTADAAFSLRVPALDAARSLRIRRGDEVLLERDRSGAAPTVQVQTPGTVQLGADLTIKWTAADADGDALRHFVSLSKDGGQTWQSLGETTDSELTVKATLAINGTDVRVRVTTSDGWNTTSAESGSFGVGGQLSDGKVVVNAFGDRSVWTVNLDGTGAQRIAERGSFPAWSPNGSRLAWVGNDTQIHTAGPDGGGEKPITSVPSPQGFSLPVWANDDTLTPTYFNEYGFYDGRRTVDATTGAVSPFPIQYANICDFTSDGSRFLVTGGLYSDGWTVYNADGTNPKSIRATQECGKFSPDGRYAVGAMYNPDSNDSFLDIYVWDLQTGERRSVTNHKFGAFNAYPTWSPTGDWIVWGSSAGQPGGDTGGFHATHIWKIHPDGTGAQEILGDEVVDDHHANFERPDVQPLRGEAPAPEPTREELKPVADAGGPYSGAEGAQIQLDARGSKPGEDGAAITGYAWDLDADGAYDDAEGAQPKAGFPDDGTYSVAVQVTDAKGRIATATADVKVLNAAPAISAAKVSEHAFTATVKDPGVQDVLTAKLDWGDGSPAETVPVIAGEDGALVSAEHAAPGATVKLTVTDGDGGSATATATRVLAPVNNAPGADDAAAQVRQGEAVDVDLPAKDPEGDRLAYEIAGAPEHGRVLMREIDPLVPGPEVTYVADNDYTGPDAFTYRVSDGPGKSRVATVAVTVKALPPADGGPVPTPGPQPPAPEAPSERTPRGPGREGSKPVDQNEVDEVTGSAQGPRGETPAIRQIVTFPSAKRCVSRRRFRIRVRRIKGQPPYKRVKVTVNGKRAKVVRGVRDTATVDLRGLPKGRFKVRITVTLANGRKVGATRKYRTCAKRTTKHKKKGDRL